MLKDWNEKPALARLKGKKKKKDGKRKIRKGERG